MNLLPIHTHTRTHRKRERNLKSKLENALDLKTFVKGGMTNVAEKQEIMIV